MIAEANAELLEPADVPTLLGTFDVNRYLDMLTLPSAGMSVDEIEALKCSEELTVLSLTTEQLLCSRSLGALGLTFLTRIANTSFPTNLAFAFEIVLTAAVADAGLPHGWHTFFDALPFDRLSVRHIATLIHTANLALPLPPSHMGPTVLVLRRALVSSPHMATDFAAELDGGDEALPGDGAGSLWVELVGFFSRAMSEAAQGSMEEAAFISLLSLLFEVVGKAPTLINRLWFVVADLLVPAAGQLDSPALSRALLDETARLPWHSLTCHLHEDGFISQLLAIHSQLPGVAQAIFSKLDWIAYLNAIVSATDAADAAGTEGSGGNAANAGPELAALLRLVLELNLVAPQYIPTPTRAAILGQLPSAAASSGVPEAMAVGLRALHDDVWARVDGASLAARFDGSVHRQLLLSGEISSTADPSSALVDNLALLYSIAASTAHPAAISAAAAEARSLLLFCVTDQSGLLFWHLPFASHPTLISGILVPACLCLSKAEPLPHDELAASLRALLSSADLVVDPPIPLPAGLDFANTSTQPFPPFPENEGEGGGAVRGGGSGEAPSAPQSDAAAPGGRASRFGAASRWFGGGGPLAVGGGGGLRRTTQIGISDGRQAAGPTSEPPALSLFEGAANAVGLGADSGGGSAQERAFRTMAAKLRSLAVQLCKGMPRPIALIIIGLLPSTVRSASVVSVLMEAALQAYLTSAGMDAAAVVGARNVPDWSHNPTDLSFVEEPLAVLGAALASRPETSVAEMVDECMAQQSPLSLRLLLALQVQAVREESSMLWMPPAVDAVRRAAACRVHPAREFELLPLWFYVVELVADASWLHEYSAGAEAVQSFARAVGTAAGTLSASALALQGSLWDSFGKEPPPPLQMPAMQLAARALLLFLNHTLEAKARNALPAGGAAVDFSVGSAELRTQAGTLMRCAQQSPFRTGFEEFFGALQTMCNRSGLTSLSVYKKEVVRTLLPMAPYLAGL